MRVLLLTDIHGDVEKLQKILSREKYDTVLCAGDLSDAREFEDYESRLREVLDSFDQKGKMARAVPGNMDPEEECVGQLIDYRMNIHKKIASFESFEAVGFGGGITPFGTPFEPEGSEIKDAVETLHQRMKADNKVAVIHQPPAETELDIADGEHVGSSEVRELIQEKDFDLVLTGHIHESRGSDEIGGTPVVNPGPVMDGYYGIAEIEDRKIELELRSL
ncbi:MAG: metallophosphoesterase [Candidatus Nanohaloarchaea archaeon]